MGKSSKAPEYANTKYDTGGLFGSSTTDKKGTTFNPTDNMSNIAGTSLTGWNKSLNNLLSNDYANDPNFKVFQDNFNRNAQNSFETNVLNPLQSQGLMRSSALQSATNSFNETMNNNLANLYDSYYNRQANNLSQMQNSASTLYDMIMGVNKGSQANSQNVSNHQMEAYKADQALKSAMWQSLGQAAGSAAGVALAASDINVKENIKPIGEKNGYQWYEFTYKEGLGLPEGVQTGVIAQEVEKINPDAVVEIDGIKHVDYSKL